MRFIVTDKGLGLNQIESEAIRLGGRNIKKAPRAGQLFCDLDPAAADKLKTIPNITVKPVKRTTTCQAPVVPEAPVYSALQASLASRFWDFRNMFTPPVTGEGLTVAILDSGVRKTHVGLKDKVVYEINFTDSPDSDDHFSHGTGAAFLIAGGTHALSAECGIAPGAKIMNIKVIGDDGTGTDEWLIEGMDEARGIFDECAHSGMDYFDPMYLNAVNISVGCPDDGDPENSLREATERLYGASPGKFPIFCSAGNSGPDERTVDLPAAARHAWAVGGVTFEPFDIWEKSSRGPSKVEGLVKPEMVFYGVNILTAGAASDEEFVVKSGTSFSSPLALGHLCLYREVAARYGFLDALLEMSYEDLEVFVQTISVKPPGTPLEKDSFYGYGMPFGDLLARAVPTYPTADIGWLYQLMGLMIPVGMAGALLKEMR
jgi:serine protease AprX